MNILSLFNYSKALTLTRGKIVYVNRLQELYNTHVSHNYTANKSPLRLNELSHISIGPYTYVHLRNYYANMYTSLAINHYEQIMCGI